MDLVQYRSILDGLFYLSYSYREVLDVALLLILYIYIEYSSANLSDIEYLIFFRR